MRTTTPSRVGALLTGAVLALTAVAAPAPVVAAAAFGEQGPTATVTADGPDLLSIADSRSGAISGTVPARPGFTFLGEPGTAVWALPDTGLDTTRASGGTGRTGPVTVELLGADGPGTFHAYTLSGVGEPEPLLGPKRPSVELPAGARTGTVWAFTRPGDYAITLGVRAGVADERTTYQVSVPGDAPKAQLVALAVPDAVGRKAAARPAAAAAQTDRRVIAEGHVDMGPRLLGGQWRLQLRDDTASPSAWRELADTVLHVVDQSKITVPEGEQYRFLGEAGDEVWLLPQAQQTDIVWPGWNTQDPSVVSAVPGNVTWTVRAVDGPGRFGLFLTGSFGEPQVLFDPTKPWPQQLAIPPNTHAHGNWVFTEPGIYRLTSEMTATTAGGEQLADTATLTLFVGPGDPDTAFAPGGNTPGGSTPDGNKPGGLPLTGGDLVLPALIGALLVGAGVALVVVVRRRRAATS